MQINPIPHFCGEVVPLVFVFEDLFPAGFIVFCNGDLLANIFFSDSQHFFNTQFHGQAMRVPASLSVYLESPHSFVPANKVFQRAAYDMMNTRHAIGTRRPLVKYKGSIRSAEANAFFEGIFAVPYLQYLLFNRGEVQLLKFTILDTHKIYWKSRQMYRKSKHVQ